MDSETMSDLDSALWNEINPSRCPCRGTGWLLSGYDTWHRCHVHGAGVPHPEDEEGRDGFDSTAHSRKLLRAAYRQLQETSGLTRDAFRYAVNVRLTGIDNPSPEEWVDAADAISREAWMVAADARARAEGYSCRLEAAWAAGGRDEAAERSGVYGVDEARGWYP